jgi:CheY-like chemotaxis protein
LAFGFLLSHRLPRAPLSAKHARDDRCPLPDGYVANGVDLLDTLAVSSYPQLGSGSFDLVISDVRMPGSTGLQVLLQMAGAPRIPPFILITAFEGEELHAAAEDLGVLAVFDKPFDVDELRRFVSAFLDASGA